jgi:hypothetical protein
MNKDVQVATATRWGEMGRIVRMELLFVLAISTGLHLRSSRPDPMLAHGMDHPAFSFQGWPFVGGAG